MAGRARQSILVKATVDLRILSQRPGKYAHWIVAAIAMARKLDALRARQNVHAGPIERRTKRVRMQRLTPFGISLRMASATVLG